MDSKYMGNAPYLCLAGNSNLTGTQLTLSLWILLVQEALSK